MGVLLQELQTRLNQPDQSELLLEKMANIAVEKFLTSKETSQVVEPPTVDKTAQVNPQIEEEILDKIADKIIISYLDSQTVPAIKEEAPLPEVAKEAQTEEEFEEKLVGKIAKKLVAIYNMEKPLIPTEISEPEVEKEASKSTDKDKVEKKAAVLDLLTDDEIENIMEKHAAGFAGMDKGLKALGLAGRKKGKAIVDTATNVATQGIKKGKKAIAAIPSWWNTLSAREKQYIIGGAGVGAGALGGAVIAKD